MPVVRKPGGWEVRLRYGAGQRGRFLIRVEGETEAENRAARLQVMASRLANAGKHAEAKDILTRAAGAKSNALFAKLEAVVSQVAPSDVVPSRTGPRTFRDVAELWVSGALHQRYPDDVPFKKPEGLANSRAILATFYPALGAMDVDAITIDDIDRARQEIPSDLGHETRRAYLRHLRRVFLLAVDPLRLIERSPIRGKFVPLKRQGRSFPFLYPSEDAQLLACADVPFAFRFLYGFLDRDGSRISETIRARWSQVDLERGVFRMEGTKTGRARYWKLDQDVHRALMLRWHQMGQPAQDARVFVDPHGERLTRQRVHHVFREHLLLAGVTREELHTATDERRPLRVHDLRATFVTLALALGRSERWVMDHTGHETSAMLARYNRQARHAAELGLGWFGPMHELLGFSEDLAQGVGYRVGLNDADTWILGDSAIPRTSVQGAQDPEKPAESEPSRVTSETRGPAENMQVGQAGPDSPVEQALAAALTSAMAAEQWQLAQSIVNELGERRRARVAPAVPSLADARKKRDEGGGK